MAQGYDNRGGGRQSFAFQPRQAAQGRGGLSGQGPRAGVQGGQATSGVVSAGLETNVGNTPSGIPALIEELAKPHIEARQKEQFYKGVAAVQNGAAIAEIEEARPAWSRMFGPSFYEEGAQMYTAQSGVLEWEQAQMARMDELKRMTPEELGKDFADTSAALTNTGSRMTDNLINQQLVERSGSFMKLVAAERVKFQQAEVTAAQSRAIGLGSNAFEQQARAFAEIEDPNDEANTGFATARQNYLNLLKPPIGQTEESYKAMIYQSGLTMMQEGSFYSYEALQGSGVFALLPEDQQRRLDERYDRLSAKRIDEAKAQLGPELWKFYEDVEKGNFSGLELASELQGFNDRLTRMTGIRRDAFTFDETTREIRSGVRENLRLAERAEDIARTERHRQEDANIEAEKEAAEAANALALVSAGQMGRAKATGLASAQDLELAADTLFQNGDYAALARNGVETSTSVKGQIESLISYNQKDGFQAESFQKAYQAWQGFNAADPGGGTRAAYFGANDKKFLLMDQIIRSGETGINAYARAFATPNLPSPSGDNARKASILSVVREHSPGWMERTFAGARSLNPSAEAVLGGVIERDFAARKAATPGISDKDAMNQSLRVAMSSGELEIVGADAILNTSTDKRSLATLTGLDARSLGDTWSEAVEDGFGRFKPASRSIARITGATGQPVFVVTGYDGAEYRTITVSPSDLIRRNTDVVRAATESPQRQYRAWISEPGISFIERNKRVHSREDFLAGRVRLGQNAP